MSDHHECRGPRPCATALAAAVYVCVVAALPTAQTRAPSGVGGSLVVTVLDPSGAAVPTATVTITPDGAAAGPSVPAAPSGTATADGLAPGRYTIRVDAPGFEASTVTGVPVRAGRRAHHTIRLAIAMLAARVDVARDARSAALDPRGFSTFLSRDQIDALPDDPEAFVQALRDLAPPGTVLRIDGFTGGVLPPKAQILSIRIPRLDSFAAEEHGGLTSLSVIDIVTRPGAGRVRGSSEVVWRHDTWSARNPLAHDAGHEPLRTGAVALDGPILPARLSFALAARGGHQQQTATVRATHADGRVAADAVPQPQQSLTLSGRLASSLWRDHTLRVSFSTDRRLTRNLGVGALNLPERGYTTGASETVVRSAAGGPLGRRGFLDVRVQTQWTGTRTEANVEAPTLRVLDAFTAGGAQLAGGARSFEWLAASDVDYAVGPHAWRAGVLVEGGLYRSNRLSNYLGTFTFSSLDDYLAGRPAAYTRRIGDARAQYRNLQIGAYLQDDVRVARSLLVNYGVRYEWQSLVAADRLSLLPRTGLTWSPFASGTTTVRFGWGLFSDWLSPGVYAQSLTVDGVRQHDVHIRHPAYPEPEAGGDLVARDRYALSSDLRLPRSMGASVGVEQQVTPGLRLHAVYRHRTGWRLLRGRNLNAPLDGLRPDPTTGNVIETRHDAGLRVNDAMVHVVLAPAQSPVHMSAGYTFTRHHSNTTGPFGIPTRGDRLDLEWGPTTPAHGATATATIRATPALRVTVNPRWRSGTPYSITTGRDDNGDGLFTDRPEGDTRNGARTSPYWDVGARISYVVRFGPIGGVDLLSAGGDAQSARAGSVSGGRADAMDARRYRVEVFATVQNLTNHANYVALSSVRTSPLFGQPIQAAGARRIDIGARFAF